MKIKYDEREWNLLKRLAVICTCTALTAFCVVWILDEEILRSASAVFWVIALLSFIFFGILSLILWVTVFDCFFYRKRLAKHGYLLPERRKDYGNTLANLPRNPADAKQQEKTSRESVVLAALAWLGAVFVLGHGLFRCYIWRYGAWYLRKSWYPEYSGQVRKLYDEFRQIYFNPSKVEFLVIILTLNCLFWVAAGFFFFHQRRNDKYRDDVDIVIRCEQNRSMPSFAVNHQPEQDLTPFEANDQRNDPPAYKRRPRIQLLDGIVLIATLFLFFYMIQESFFSFQDYMVRDAWSKYLAEHELPPDEGSLPE